MFSSFRPDIVKENRILTLKRSACAIHKIHICAIKKNSQTNTWILDLELLDLELLDLERLALERLAGLEILELELLDHELLNREFLSGLEILDLELLNLKLPAGFEF